jgi:hypothetical protein
MWQAKVGAVSYALWSILHIILGASRLAERATNGTLSEAAGRLAQGHWTLLYLGIFGLILSAFNWRNNAAAYWVAAFVISAEDIGFLLFPVAYGGLGFPASTVGPVLWIIGLIFTSWAYFGAQKQQIS